MVKNNKLIYIFKLIILKTKHPLLKVHLIHSIQIDLADLVLRSNILGKIFEGLIQAEIEVSFARF